MHSRLRNKREARKIRDKIIIGGSGINGEHGKLGIR